MKMKFYLIVLSLLAVCLWGTGDVRAQSASRSMTVTGKVVDQNGAAVTGASVVVVGTTKGTTTGADGAFSLTGVASDARLAVNFIGYKTQTVEVGGRTSFNIVLVEEATAVDEVVVVGYGQVKKSDLTGSVASVKAEKLTDIPANSIDGLLQGRVAGVQVVNSSQDPGASSTVRIRGNSSLNGSNAPLVVIDGFPWGDAGDLKQINPQDIVSMEVLKDASASAIYGSRGANGVILITTRKAQENVTRITLRQQTTVSGFSSELNLWRDPVLMAMLSNESSINAGLTPTYIGATNANGVYYPSIAELQTTWTTNTRWDDLVFRPTPVSNNTTVQVQSSNDRTMFQASANYYLDNGMYIEDTYRKYGGNFSVEHKLLDNLRMKASANITSNKRHNNGGLAYWRNPIFPVYDDNGDYWLYGAQDYSHPLALTDLQKNDSKGLDIISFASVNWDVLPCLNVMAQFNYKHGEQITDKYFPKKYSETGVFNDGYGSIDNWKDDNIVFEAYATFDRTFAEKHRLTVMGGYSYENYQSRSSSLAAKGFINESLGNENLAAGDSETYSIGNGSYKTELVSALTRINYTFDNRFLFTFTARADGSSKFAKGNRWAFFPAVSVGWRIDKENFMQNVRAVDVLKLRGSVGEMGNQAIGNYEYLMAVLANKSYNYSFGDVLSGGAAIKDFVDENISWETTRTYNLGLDFEAFDHRLLFSVDLYKKRTEGILRDVKIPAQIGNLNGPKQNIGVVANDGVELNLQWRSAVKNFHYSLGGNFCYNKNIVVDLDGQEYIKTFNIIREGEPIDAWYLYQADGFYNSYEEIANSVTVGSGVKPGYIRYKNLNNDDKIDNDDRAVCGNLTPSITYAFNFSLGWKGLELSAQFQGVADVKTYLSGNLAAPFWNGAGVLKEWATDAWTPENHNSRLPILHTATGAPEMHDYKNTQWLYDASYLRCKQLQLSYTLPKRWISKLGMSQCQIFVNGENLFTISPLKMFDPEIDLSSTNLMQYPSLRTINFGFNITF